MTMATDTPAERQQVIDGLAREIVSVARELAEVGLTADLAVARHDWECGLLRIREIARATAELGRSLPAPAGGQSSAQPDH
jgi:hypothetical protein